MLKLENVETPKSLYQVNKEYNLTDKKLSELTELDITKAIKAFYIVVSRNYLEIKSAGDLILFFNRYLGTYDRITEEDSKFILNLQNLDLLQVKVIYSSLKNIAARACIELNEPILSLLDDQPVCTTLYDTAIEYTKQMQCYQVINGILWWVDELYLVNNATALTKIPYCFTHTSKNVHLAMKDALNQFYNLELIKCEIKWCSIVGNINPDLSYSFGDNPDLHPVAIGFINNSLLIILYMNQFLAVVNAHNSKDFLVHSFR